MTTADYMAKFAEIEDQNNRMTGLVCAFVIGVFTLLIGFVAVLPYVK